MYCFGTLGEAGSSSVHTVVRDIATSMPVVLRQDGCRVGGVHPVWPRLAHAERLCRDVHLRNYACSSLDLAVMVRAICRLLHHPCARIGRFLVHTGCLAAWPYQLGCPARWRLALPWSFPTAQKSLEEMNRCRGCRRPASSTGTQTFQHHPN